MLGTIIDVLPKTWKGIILKERECKKFSYFEPPHYKKMSNLWF